MGTNTTASSQRHAAPVDARSLPAARAPLQGGEHNHLSQHQVSTSQARKQCRLVKGTVELAAWKLKYAKPSYPQEFAQLLEEVSDVVER